MWWVHVVIPIVAAIVVNACIFLLKWNENSTRNPLLPPGYIIGLVWIIIFGILGLLHYKLYPLYFYASWAVVSLIMFCLLYPFMTAGLSNSKWSKILNLMTLVFSFIVAIIVPRSYVLYMLPIILWASYVNVTQLMT